MYIPLELVQSFGGFFICLKERSIKMKTLWKTLQACTKARKESQKYPATLTQNVENFSDRIRPARPRSALAPPGLLELVRR